MILNSCEVSGLCLCVLVKSGDGERSRTIHSQHEQQDSSFVHATDYNLSVHAKSEQGALIPSSSTPDEMTDRSILIEECRVADMNDDRRHEAARILINRLANSSRTAANKTLIHRVLAIGKAGALPHCYNRGRTIDKSHLDEYRCAVGIIDGRAVVTAAFCHVRNPRRRREPPAFTEVLLLATDETYERMGYATEMVRCIKRASADAQAPLFVVVSSGERFWERRSIGLAQWAPDTGVPPVFKPWNEGIKLLGCPIHSATRAHGQMVGVVRDTKQIDALPGAALVSREVAPRAERPSGPSPLTPRIVKGARGFTAGKSGYLIEVLDTKRDKALVRYVGFSAKYDSWIRQDKIELFPASRCRRQSAAAQEDEKREVRSEDPASMAAVSTARAAAAPAKRPRSIHGMSCRDASHRPACLVAAELIAGANGYVHLRLDPSMANRMPHGAKRRSIDRAMTHLRDYLAPSAREPLTSTEMITKPERKAARRLRESVMCAGCGQSESAIGSRFELAYMRQRQERVELCARCAERRRAGEYCPVCGELYMESEPLVSASTLSGDHALCAQPVLGPLTARMANAEDTMIECAECKRWVHTSCESLPPGVADCIEASGMRYTCPACRREPPGQGSIIADALRSFYLAASACPGCAIPWLDCADQMQMVQCDQCDLWVHIQCERLPQSCFKFLEGDHSYQCPLCRGECAGKGTRIAELRRLACEEDGCCAVCFQEHPPNTSGGHPSSHVEWVECDRCSVWVHVVCEGLPEGSAQRFSTTGHRYECPSCRGARPIALAQPTRRKTVSAEPMLEQASQPLDAQSFALVPTTDADSGGLDLDADPKLLIERRVQVYWELDVRWYSGLVKSYTRSRGWFVEYDDIEGEDKVAGWHDLRYETWQLLVPECMHAPKPRESGLRDRCAKRLRCASRSATGSELGLIGEPSNEAGRCSLPSSSTPCATALPSEPAATARRSPASSLDGRRVKKRVQRRDASSAATTTSTALIVY